MDFVPRHPLVRAVLAVICSAGLSIAGNGMNPVWPLMWIAVLPVLLFAAASHSSRLTTAVAALSMLLGSLPMLRYLHGVLHAPITAWLVPFSLASLLFAAGVLLFRGLLHRGSPFTALIALPAFWATCEFIASFVPANGTAGSLSYTQERFLPLLQVASLTGPWGITFLLLLFPSAVATALYLRTRNPPRALHVLAAVAATLVAALIYGAVRLSAPAPSQTVKVGLLATDTVVFAQDRAAMQQLTARYAAEAEKLAQRGATLIVMPEKTGLVRESDTAALDAPMQSTADRTGATLVFGIVQNAGAASFNQARIYTPHRPIATYNKQHMLPPFESPLTPGTSLTLLPSAPAPVGVAICKDMDFIHPALDYGRAGIALLLDPAWDFNVDRQWHGHIAIMRGVEGGYAIAHAAKDGFLTVTDNRGRILAETRTDSAPFASLLVDVPLHHDCTVFDRFGTWFPWLTTLLTVFAAFRCFTGSSPAPRPAGETVPA